MSTELFLCLMLLSKKPVISTEEATPKQIKILLIEKGLTIAEISREIAEKNGLKKESAETMVSDTLYGRRWYQTIADELSATYGIVLTRPTHTLPIRQQIKQVA